MILEKRELEEHAIPPFIAGQLPLLERPHFPREK
jgi:hypothetical protein